jgi:ABC-type transport system involved in multi-copper enzyme maturation permease subunit
MRQLFWKEWRENRLLIVWAALLTLAVLAACIAYNVAEGPPDSTDLVSSMEGFLMGVWLVCALMPSSAMVARETGSGGLQFASSLPISRAKLWWAKLIVAIAIMLVCICVSSILYALVYAAAGHMHRVTPPLKDSVNDAKDNVSWLSCLMVCVFAVGALVTMLFDRVVSAVMISIVVATTMFVIIACACSLPQLQFTSDNGNMPVVLLMVIALPIIPVCLNASYQTFVRGETLLTRLRFKVAFSTLLQSMAIILSALALSFRWLLS